MLVEESDDEGFNSKLSSVSNNTRSTENICVQAHEEERTPIMKEENLDANQNVTSLSNVNETEETENRENAVVVESEESAEYTEPESGESSSEEDSKSSSSAAKDPVIVEHRESSLPNSSFQLNRFEHFCMFEFKNQYIFQKVF